MRPLRAALLTGLLLSPLPSRAQKLGGQGPVPGAAGRRVGADPLEPDISNCSGDEKKQFIAAINDAREGYADGCLIGAGLNPALGKKILELMAGNGVRFSCEDSAQDTTVGGNGAPASIGIVTWPPRWIKGAPDMYAAVVFHELMHAVDPSWGLLLSTTLHNRGAAADGVYGCHIACLGTPMSEAPGQALALLEYAVGHKIKPAAKWKGIAGLSKEDAAVVRSYAGLCRDGPPGGAEGIKAAALLETTYCLYDGLMKNACSAKECRQLFSPGDFDPATGGLSGAAVLAVQKKLMNAARIDPAAAGPEAELARALGAAGVMRRCRDNPFSYAQ